jgi:hypothetical protein
MSLDKNALARVRRFSQAFKDARDRGSNESDTVMYLVKFFEEIMGFDSLAGEISKEVAIKDRYCDLAIKLDGEIRYLVEAKSAANKTLRDKDIEQAENYAARHGIPWVLLTNGVEWQFYHLSFNEGEGEGITHDLAFSFNLVDGIGEDSDKIWGMLQLITKDGLASDALEEFWSQKKALSPHSLIRALFSETVLTIVRRELNRTTETRLDMEDVFDGVRDVLSKDALLAAGDIVMTKKRRKRRKTRGDDAAPVQAAPGETAAAATAAACDAPAATAAAAPVAAPPSAPA